MTRRAAARKRFGLRPLSDSSLPREQDRDSSRRSFCVSPRVVGAGRGFGIHLMNVSTCVKINQCRVHLDNYCGRAGSVEQ